MYRLDSEIPINYSEYSIHFSFLSPIPSVRRGTPPLRVARMGPPSSLYRESSPFGTVRSLGFSRHSILEDNAERVQDQHPTREYRDLIADSTGKERINIVKYLFACGALPFSYAFIRSLFSPIVLKQLTLRSAGVRGDVLESSRCARA